MRLIDADEFKKFIRSLTDAGAPYEGVTDLLDKQPTAYDVDKVVEQLEGKVKELENITVKMVLNKSQKARNHGYYVAIEHAIDIVRDGGKG